MTRAVTMDNKGHFLMMKWSAHHEDIVINMYVPNKRAPKYMKQKLTKMKGEMPFSVVHVTDNQ